MRRQSTFVPLLVVLGFMMHSGLIIGPNTGSRCDDGVSS